MDGVFAEKNPNSFAFLQFLHVKNVKKIGFHGEDKSQCKWSQETVTNFTVYIRPLTVPLLLTLFILNGS